MMEQVALFGQTKSLVGVVTEPNSDSRNGHLPAIIILNAGLLHRIGPNRLHVKIARKMADTGFSVLRFDFSGIGDSGPREDDLPFEKSSVKETQEAMHYLSSARDIQRFILIGICSGASVAFRTACRDPRVVGAVGVNGAYLDSQVLEGLNPYVESSIRGRYYRKRILDYRSWWRVITGKSDLRSAIKHLATKAKSLLCRRRNLSVETDPFIEWNPLIERGSDLFLIYSEGSTAFDTFHLLLKDRIAQLESSGKLRVEVVEHTDHVFTLLWSQEVLVELVGQWVQNRERNWITD